MAVKSCLLRVIIRPLESAGPSALRDQAKVPIDPRGQSIRAVFCIGEDAIMRMWNVPPPLMCRQHFLGEHNEEHKFEGHLNRGRQLGKYAEGMCQVSDLPRRHAELVEEFERRGYNHDSPLPEIVNYKGPDGWVFDVEHNLRELARRCPECAKMQAERACEFGYEDLVDWAFLREAYGLEVSCADI